MEIQSAQVPPTTSTVSETKPVAPAPHTVTPHESHIKRIEDEFDTLIARAESFLKGLIEHKAVTVENLRAANTPTATKLPVQPLAPVQPPIIADASAAPSVVNPTA